MSDDPIQRQVVHTMPILMTIDSRPGSDQGHLPHHIPIHVQETSHAHQLGEGGYSYDRIVN